MLHEGDFIFEYCMINGEPTIKLYKCTNCSGFLEFKVAEAMDLFSSFADFKLNYELKVNIFFLKIQKENNVFTFEWSEIQ
jgi:hypothetical protein